MYFIIDNEPANEISLNDLLTVNDFEENERQDILNMQVGDCLYFALGTELKRVK